VIQGNLIGVSPDGTRAYGNADNGIDHNYGSKGNLIGGAGPLEGNVISGNGNDGIEISHGWNPALPPRADPSQPFALVGNRIIGNNIGFRPDGAYDPSFRNGGCYPACAVDNGQGVNLVDGVSDTVVQGNWIIGVRSGLQVSAVASVGNVIEGNHVGISPTGAVGRIEQAGIVLHDGTSGNLIARNTIGGNRYGAIFMDDPASFRNRVTQNAILSAAAPAIDLFPTGVANVNGSLIAGSEASERYPLLLAVSRRVVSGSAPPGSIVELFAAGARPGFFGPGRTYLRTVRATATGRFRIRVRLRPGVVLTSTAYGLRGMSEFGPNVAVPGGRRAAILAHLQDASGTCLGVAGGSTKAGARVIVDDCSSRATQRWTFATDGTIRVFSGARCLAPAAGKARRLAHVVVVACPRRPAWRWVRTSRGWIRTGAFCLDPRSAVAGSPVRLTRCSNLAEKVWSLRP
jgi:Ricin-type beta-trefoil lectin domain